ncbi:MAG: DNA cytosine methyltransferase [Spartobacteria bacterium]|nr:DNA cytosine methyltransferase [Spartobacteria bacterium]
MKKKIIVDMFSGAGGESSGIMLAANSIGLNVELHAINHWERAIETHCANHPGAKHYCEQIQNLDPSKVIPGSRVELLWASPECTHHSNARGGKPRSDQSRASAWLILKWLQELYVDRVIIENVPEFLSWGPLNANGTPMQSKKGEIFRAYVSALNALGYRVDWRLMRAADYGTPTTRVRLFIQAVRGKKQILWPAETHTNTPGLFEQQTWVPARDIIDWSIPGESIFARKKPLAAATMRRIEHGIRQYWGDLATPFLVILRGTSNTRSVDRPVPTITSGGGHIGVVAPAFTIPQHSCGAPRDIDQPLSTITTTGAISLIQPFILATGHTGGCGNRCRDLNEPLSTVVTKAEHCLVEPFIIQYYGNGDARSINQPLDTVTCKDRFALCSGVPHQLDITFRMLQPHELARAQGFARDYVFRGNKSEQVRQIGNAVCPPVAAALAKEAFAA